MSTNAGSACIHNIPSHLLTEGFRFVSFVTSLFTNIPLRKTVNFILKRTYKDKRMTTSLNKCTLKKLVLDACTKTPFSFNNQLSTASQYTQDNTRIFQASHHGAENIAWLRAICSNSDLLTNYKELPNSHHGMDTLATWPMI